MTSQKQQYWILFPSIDFTTMSGTRMTKKTSVAAALTFYVLVLEEKKKKN